MGFQSRLWPVVTITGSSIMVGCSGGPRGSYGSCGSYAGCPPTNVAGPGLYEGTLADPATQQTNPVIAIIADNGDGRMSDQNGTYYRLTLGIAGNNLSGNFIGFSQGPNFPNGTQSTAGTVSAAAAPPGLNGTLMDQTGATGAVLLNFDTIYNMTSSLPTLAGTWSYTANGFSLTATIRPDGTFSAIDSNNCSYTGAFGLIDPNFNAYSETHTRSCAGTAVTFTGLATYFPPTGNTASAEIKILSDDNISEFLVADLQ